VGFVRPLPFVSHSPPPFFFQLLGQTPCRFVESLGGRGRGPGPLTPFFSVFFLWVFPAGTRAARPVRAASSNFPLPLLLFGPRFFPRLMNSAWKTTHPRSAAVKFSGPPVPPAPKVSFPDRQPSRAQIPTLPARFPQFRIYTPLSPSLLSRRPSRVPRTRLGAVTPPPPGKTSFSSPLRGGFGVFFFILFFSYPPCLFSQMLPERPPLVRF